MEVTTIIILICTIILYAGVGMILSIRNEKPSIAYILLWLIIEIYAYIFRKILSLLWRGRK